MCSEAVRSSTKDQITARLYSSVRGAINKEDRSRDVIFLEICEEERNQVEKQISKLFKGLQNLVKVLLKVLLMDQLE